MPCQRTSLSLEPRAVHRGNAYELGVTVVGSNTDDAEICTGVRPEHT